MGDFIVQIAQTCYELKRANFTRHPVVTGDRTK